MPLAALAPCRLCASCHTGARATALAGRQTLPCGRKPDNGRSPGAASAAAPALCRHCLPAMSVDALPPSLLRTRPIAVGHLRAFLAVARYLNFRAAAEELALTQSAVSRQIQSLEDEVGVALFLRHTRAVELTSAGAYGTTWVP